VNPRWREIVLSVTYGKILDISPPPPDIGVTLRVRKIAGLS